MIWLNGYWEPLQGGVFAATIPRAPNRPRAAATAGFLLPGFLLLSLVASRASDVIAITIVLFITLEDQVGQNSVAAAFQSRERAASCGVQSFSHYWLSRLTALTRVRTFFRAPGRTILTDGIYALEVARRDSIISSANDPRDGNEFVTHVRRRLRLGQKA